MELATPIQPVKNKKDARKKPTLPEDWKRSKEKFRRYCPPGPPLAITCNHLRQQTFKCEKITHAMQRKFHESFYSTAEKRIQDAFILRYTSASTPARHRPGTGPERAEKNLTIKYFIRDFSSTKTYSVCRTAFLNTLRIGKGRVQGVSSRHNQTGHVAPERRGGDHRSHILIHKRKAVMQFIQKFRAVESHYCRTRNKSTRVYQCWQSSRRSWHERRTRS